MLLLKATQPGRIGLVSPVRPNKIIRSVIQYGRASHRGSKAVWSTV